jgi:hypothetical protein
MDSYASSSARGWYPLLNIATNSVTSQIWMFPWVIVITAFHKVSVTYGSLALRLELCHCIRQILIKTSLATPQLMMLLQETPNMWSVQPFCLCWRLVAGGWWLEVGDWSWWQEVGGWLECVSSVCGFIVKGLFFKL